MLEAPRSSPCNRRTDMFGNCCRVRDPTLRNHKFCHREAFAARTSTGLALAQQVLCAVSCLQKQQGHSPDQDAPSFEEIASIPGMTAVALAVAILHCSAPCRAQCLILMSRRISSLAFSPSNESRWTNGLQRKSAGSIPLKMQIARRLLCKPVFDINLRLIRVRFGIG